MKNKNKLATYLWELYGEEQGIPKTDFLEALVRFEEEEEEAEQ